MHILNCCSPLCWSHDWEHCLAVGLACITDSRFLRCWDRNYRNVQSDGKVFPVWHCKSGHISQVIADIQSTTINLWGTSHKWNYHCTSLTTANKYSCLAFMKMKSWFIYLAGQQYHHLLQNRKCNPRWQHFGNDKLSLLVSQFQGSNENRLKTI